MLLTNDLNDDEEPAIAALEIEYTVNTPSPLKPKDPLAGRVKAIETILTQWDELRSPLHARTGYRNPDIYPKPPDSYNPSVRELERLIRVLRDDRHAALMLLPSGEKVSLRQQFWHLNEWYLKATTTLEPPAKIPRSKRRELRKLELTEDGKRVPVYRHVRDPQARKDIAAMAVRTLATWWSLPHEPQLPIDSKAERDR